MGSKTEGFGIKRGINFISLKYKAEVIPQEKESSRANLSSPSPYKLKTFIFKTTKYIVFTTHSPRNEQQKFTDLKKNLTNNCKIHTFIYNV